MDLTYEQWLDAVDAIMLRRIGLTHRDLADFNSRDLYNDEVPPDEGASECINNDDVYANSGL